MTTYTFNEFQEFEVGIDVSLDDLAERLDTDDLAYLLEQFDASEISSTINQLDEGTLGAAADAISARLDEDEDLSRTLDGRLTRIVESPHFGTPVVHGLPSASRGKLLRIAHNVALGTGFYENLPADERQYLAARLGSPPTDAETETSPLTNEAHQFAHFLNPRSLDELAHHITDDRAVWLLTAIAHPRSLSVLREVFQRLATDHRADYTRAISALLALESEDTSEPDDPDDSEDDDLERTLEHLVTAPSDRLAGLPDVHWHTLIQKLHPEVKTLVNQLKPDQPVPQATLDQLTQLFS